MTPNDTQSFRRPVRQAALVLAVLALFLFASMPLATQADAQESDVVVEPVTPVLSARRFAPVLQTTNADPALNNDLNAFLRSTPGDACVLVKSDGRVVVDRKADTAFAPASLMKLATAIGAMEILGSDYRMQTKFVTNGKFSNGVVDGDLYVIGGGDPLITTKGYKSVFDDPDQLLEPMGDVVNTLKEKGVKEVRGAIIGDDSRYENVRWIPSWPTRYQIGGTVSPLSALVVNDGNTGYTETPDEPTTDRKAGDPPLLFVQTLKTLLNQNGINANGEARTGRAPGEVKEVAVFESVPMIDIVNEMLANSDNTTAELVLREIGMQNSGEGTTTAGLAAVREVLSQKSIPLDGFVQVDGSGLDLNNRMSCRTGLALYETVDTYSDVTTKLPVAGRTGTLRKRMLQAEATGKVVAKTGTLNSVNALAGRATTKPGNFIEFVFIHNGTDPRGQVVGDIVAERLMTFAKGAKLSALSPAAAKQTTPEKNDK
ncbi:MAG: D-alanyl-D-alanine carboxypeptidase/D-alanyl-D-alanine-endopeptidase [Actinomycetota bacterium]